MTIISNKRFNSYQSGNDIGMLLDHKEQWVELGKFRTYFEDEALTTIELMKIYDMNERNLDQSVMYIKSFKTKSELIKHAQLKGVTF
jgi:hypothetical protein